VFGILYVHYEHLYIDDLAVVRAASASVGEDVRTEREEQ